MSHDFCVKMFTCLCKTSERDLSNRKKHILNKTKCFLYPPRTHEFIRGEKMNLSVCHH